MVVNDGFPKAPADANPTTSGMLRRLTTQSPHKSVEGKIFGIGISVFGEAIWKKFFFRIILKCILFSYNGIKIEFLKLLYQT